MRWPFRGRGKVKSPVPPAPPLVTHWPNDIVITDLEDVSINLEGGDKPLVYFCGQFESMELPLGQVRFDFKSEQDAWRALKEILEFLLRQYKVQMGRDR